MRAASFCLQKCDSWLAWAEEEGEGLEAVLGEAAKRNQPAVGPEFTGREMDESNVDNL